MQRQGPSDKSRALTTLYLMYWIFLPHCWLYYERLSTIHFNTNWITMIQCLYLYIYLRALSSECVTVTDGDYRLLLHSYRHVITLQLHQLWNVWSADSSSIWIFMNCFWCPACVLKMKYLLPNQNWGKSQETSIIMLYYQIV